jgi:hypothetical protein
LERYVLSKLKMQFFLTFILQVSNSSSPVGRAILPVIYYICNNALHFWFARVAIELLVPGYESETEFIPTVLGAGPPNNGMPKANTSSWLAAGMNTTS